MRLLFFIAKRVRYNAPDLFIFRRRKIHLQKIFTTQLIGLLNQTLDEDILEDAARLLSQALVGDGSVYIYGKDEMVAVSAEALYGKEKLQNVKPLMEKGKIVELDPADRVLLISRNAYDEEMMQLIEQVSAKGILIVGMSAVQDDSKKQWTDWTDVHLHLKVENSLVPTDDGERIGYPASLMALYTYFCLHLLITDFLSEYES